MDLENYGLENSEEVDLKTEFESIEPNFDLTKIYDEAMENYTTAKSAWEEIHRESIDDKTFALLGQQWRGDVLAQRNRDKKTSKVFDNCGKYVRYVVNSSLKNSPAIKVTAKSKDKKKEADVIAGIIRRIESDSNAKQVYSNAFSDCVAGGLGVFEIVIDAEDQENPLKIKRIIDPTSIFPDPEAIEPDFSDMRYLIRTKNIPKKIFIKNYPNIEATCQKEGQEDWFTSDSVQVIEYWTKEGNTVDWYLINGNEVIDSSIKYGGFQGKYIPFCFMTGEDVIVNGERHFKSLIREIKPRQEYSNFISSEIIDYMARSSQAGWMLNEKVAEKYLDIYQDPSKNSNVLVYQTGAEKPTKIEPPQPPTAFLNEISRIEQEMRSSVGIRDNFTDIPNMQSGRATQLQLAQQNLSTALWTDHLNLAVKTCGKILCDLIPKYFNFPHETQILGLDGQLSTASIQTPDENGNKLDLSGEYYVNISTGASYADQQEATFDKLLELSKTNPQLAQLGSDIMVKNLDIVESEILADRLYAMLPPQIQALNKTDVQDPKMMMMQIQKQMEEMGKVLEQTTQALTQKTQEANELQNMVQNKSQIEMAKIESQNQNKLQTEVMGNQSAEQQIVMKGEYDLKMKQLEMEYQLKLKQMDLEIEKVKSMSQLAQNVVPEIIQTTY